MVTMIAIEPCNSVKAGSEFEVSEREAAQLVQRGLARMKGPAENKMAPAGENKANPTPAAGAAAGSSASPAGQASPKKTARGSRGGSRKAKAEK